MITTEGVRIADFTSVLYAPGRSPEIPEAADAFGWPVHNHFEDQIGRWSGKDVVQVGVGPDGTPTGWTLPRLHRTPFTG